MLEALQEGAVESVLQWIVLRDYKLVVFDYIRKRYFVLRYFLRVHCVHNVVALDARSEFPFSPACLDVHCRQDR